MALKDTAYKTIPGSCLHGICWHAYHVRRQITADKSPPWTGAKYVRAGKIIVAKVQDPRKPRLQELLQSWYLFCLMQKPEALGMGMGAEEWYGE